MYNVQCTLYNAMFRIRKSCYADSDPDPGSQTCPYGSGSGCVSGSDSGSGSKGVNTKEEKLNQQVFS